MCFAPFYLLKLLFYQYYILYNYKFNLFSGHCLNALTNLLPYVTKIQNIKFAFVFFYDIFSFILTNVFRASIGVKLFTSILSISVAISASLKLNISS